MYVLTVVMRTCVTLQNSKTHSTAMAEATET